MIFLMPGIIFNIVFNFQLYERVLVLRIYSIKYIFFKSFFISHETNNEFDSIEYHAILKFFYIDVIS
jgi:hypothetical protein